jgi:hypothetical protein
VLTVTQKQILESLRDDGVLVDDGGAPRAPTDKATSKGLRLGKKVVRCLLVLRQALGL